MGNKADNFFEIVKNSCSEIVCAQTDELFVGVEKASPAKQGKFIKACLEVLQNNQIDIKKIMRPCNCLTDSVIAKAKKSYALANGDISEFLCLLNEQHIGGGQLRLDDSGKIIGVYSHCYCGIPKVTKNMPSCYCECSAGWFEKLFSNIFERNVQVKIIHTILSGAIECVFEIS